MSADAKRPPWQGRPLEGSSPGSDKDMVPIAAATIHLERIADAAERIAEHHEIVERISAALVDGVGKPGPATTDRLRTTMAGLINLHGIDRVRRALGEVST